MLADVRLVGYFRFGVDASAEQHRQGELRPREIAHAVLTTV